MQNTILNLHFFSDDYFENANKEKELKEDAVKCFLQIRAYFGFGFFFPQDLDSHNSKVCEFFGNR